MTRSPNRPSDCSRPPRWHERGGAGRSPAHALPGLLAVLVASLVACGGPDHGGPRVRVPDGTPLVVISVDTLRSDRLPMYGYDRVDTPALDTLREEGILFEHAYSPVPMTLPAHTSLLSGLLPADHGVRDNIGYSARPEDHPWLPRTLAEQGYRTGAAVSTFVLRSTTGLGSDFDLYEDRILQRSWEIGDAQRTGDRTLEASRDWLRSVEDEPFFFLFHLYEPHQPLTPPEPFASRYRSAYDGEVASADAIVGDFLDELRTLGIYDRAVIVFLSDHGEGLGDHGIVEHGPLLYREQIQVPLVLKLPGGELGGTSASAPAQLVDVMPTFLELLGLERPETLRGSSLLALLADDPPTRSVFGETHFPRVQFGWSELSSVIQYPYHLIQGPDPELYDLEADPEEQNNILREERRAYASLRDALETYDGSYQPPTENESPEVRAQLASLGYLGGGAAETDGPLADPKSKLHVLNDLGRARQAAKKRNFAEAARIYRSIVEEEPEVLLAWEYLGNALLRQGRIREALEAYREHMRLSGGSPLAAMNVAGVLLRMGRLEEAEEHALIAAEAQHRAYDLLAQIALRRGDLDEAERYVEKALSQDNGQPGPQITKANLLLRRGGFDEALELTREVEERVAGQEIDEGFLRGLYLVRGEALAQKGEARPAAEAFLREIEISPHHLAPYTRLALLYALSGQGASAGRALQQMVQANPTPAAYAEAARTMRVLGDSRSASRLLEQARQRWPDAPELEPEAVRREAAGS